MLLTPRDGKSYCCWHRLESNVLLQFEFDERQTRSPLIMATPSLTEGFESHLSYLHN